MTQTVFSAERAAVAEAKKAQRQRDTEADRRLFKLWTWQTYGTPGEGRPALPADIDVSWYCGRGEAGLRDLERDLGIHGWVLDGERLVPAETAAA